jgi:CRP/FNR family cyclic AMP-dependent transcriptional regulator
LENIEKIISEHPFFNGIDQQTIKVIAENSRRLNFNPGEFLMREDEPGHCFFLILHGKVAIEVFAPERGPIIVSTIGENEICGYCWLIPPYTCRYDVRAVEFTRCICIDGTRLREICDENPKLGFELLRRTTQLMSSLLEATRVQVLDIYGDHSER